MRAFDFGSWEGVLTAVVGIALISLIGVGLRLLVMLTIQQRQQAANRQINERLRTLIAAYKTLGGSFTGELSVDPTHLRELRRRAREPATPTAEAEASVIAPAEVDPGTGERARRIRDAVEGALSDILLLGTEEQVRLAAAAAHALAEGRPIHTAELVVSLRSFIRKVLDLAPVPHGLSLPPQGPTRPAAGAKGGGRDDGRLGGPDSGRQGGRGIGGGGGAGTGVGAGLGIAAGSEGGDR